MMEPAKSRVKYCQRGVLQIARMVNPHYQPQPKLPIDNLIKLLNQQDGGSQTKQLIFELINTTQLSALIFKELGQLRTVGLELSLSDISLASLITKMIQINSFLKCKQLLQPLNFHCEVGFQLDSLIENVKTEAARLPRRQIFKNVALCDIISKDLLEIAKDILNNQNNYLSISRYHNPKQYHSYTKLKYVHLNILRNILSKIMSISEQNKVQNIDFYVAARKMYIKILALYVCSMDLQSQEIFRISQFHAQKDEKQNSCLHYLKFSGGIWKFLNYIEEAPPTDLKHHKIYFESITNPSRT